MSLSSFIHQKTYERVEHLVRRHPLTVFPAFAFLIVLLATPVGVFLLLLNTTTLLQHSGVALLLILLGSSYALAVGLFYYTYFVNYYLDLLLITNDRLLRIEQDGLFSRTISEVDLYKIQDVTSTVKGFWPSLFGYGDLLIQTAAAIDEFRIVKIPNPEKLRQEIMDLAEGDRQHHMNTKNAG